MKDQAEFWDGAAEKYARAPVRDEAAYAETLARVRAHLTPSDHMLEIGCGTGSTALTLSDAVARVTATDISTKMIEIAEDKARAQGVGNVEFQRAAADDRILDAGAADVATAFNLLHLMRDPEAVVRSIHAQVKPGGLFISKTPGRPGRGAPLFYRVMLLALPLLQAIGKAPFVRFLDRAALAELIEGAGFEIIETGDYPAAPPSHFIVARRL